MDESRARALLRAERAEVATLLRETEESESEAEQAPDSPTDFGDQGLALTEEEDEGDVTDQLRERLGGKGRAGTRVSWPPSTGNGAPPSMGRWPGSRPPTMVCPCSAESRSRPSGSR